MRDGGLEFWFEYGSTYAYLSVARIDTVVRTHGITVEWRPFLLMPIMIEQGMQQGAFLPYPAKLRYMWRDLERRAARYVHRLPQAIRLSPEHILTARIGRLAQQGGWCAEFTKEVFRLHWTEDVIIGTDENIDRTLRSLGKDVDRIVALALSDRTKQAKTLGIFGSPTFIVGDEIFWGDDRLEDAVHFLGLASNRYRDTN
jgi:2-hydroxychromene-2-carboxylate isomerase